MHRHILNSIDKGFDDLGYNHVPAAGNDSRGLPEVALWCAVLEQAFVDIGLIKPINASVERRPGGYEYDEALRFLQRDRKHFFFVCSLAGVNPVVVRQGAMRVQNPHV